MINATDMLKQIKENIATVIIGKNDVVDLLLISLLCEGHVLIEDIPGVGKTSLASALARSVGCTFRRIQFTPDVLPADVTGYNMINLTTGQPEFHPGSVMTHVLLADEINRTSPKTQSALLEAMAERQVTVDGVTYPLERPFLVMATQNPVEYIGTYPLPEAQMDRFLMRLRMGYPTMVQELEILKRYANQDPRPTLPAIVSAEEIIALQDKTKAVYADPVMMEYIISIVNRTRNHEDLELGISPRGSLALLSAAQGAAVLSGRDYIIPDDIQLVAEPVLAHRVILKPEARLKDINAERIIKSVLNTVNVPVLVG
ncbi:MAG: AAA family ATPase [Christensenellales bacterium]|jgi:MoxR-like ATPase